MLKQTFLVTTLLSVALMTTPAISGSHEKTVESNPWDGLNLEQKISSMPKGDAIRGKAVHEQMMCNTCHGPAGESPSRNYPTLSGQSAKYIMKMMLDYQVGRRWEDHKQSEIMVKLANTMDDQKIADIAEFYAGQPRNAWGFAQPVQQGAAKSIAQLVMLGDDSRMIIGCATCHGAAGEGSGIIPALAGQVPEYFKRATKAFRSDNRLNDVNELMRQIADRLTDEEIDAMADYYASLGTAPKAN